MKEFFPTVVWMIVSVAVFAAVVLTLYGSAFFSAELIDFLRYLKHFRG